MSLDDGRKTDYPEESHTDMREICKLHTERPWSRIIITRIIKVLACLLVLKITVLAPKLNKQRQLFSLWYHYENSLLHSVMAEQK